MTDLQRAIFELGAVRVGRARYAYSEGSGEDRLYVVASDDMRLAGREIRKGTWDYSLWCASTTSESPSAAEKRRYEEG